MTLTSCDPCDCIQGYISVDKFKQDVEVILCNILSALGGGSDRLLDTHSFTAVGSDTAVGPFNGLNRVSMQVFSVGGQPGDWSVELYGSFDGVTYGRILTHSLAVNEDGGYSVDSVVGVKYVKIVVKDLTLGGASSITVNVYGNAGI